MLLVNGVCALGQGVISSNSSSGINLDAAFPLPIITVTVAPGVVVDNSTGGTDAIFGSSRAWQLINNGATLFGASNGVRLDLGGLVQNQSGGLIHGDANGVTLNGSGTVLNSASVSAGSGFGIGLFGGGTVQNLAVGGSSGNIQAETDGIVISGGTGSVFNAGTLSAASGSGISLLAGGQIRNQSSGVIQGGLFGVSVSRGTGSLINLGSILNTATSSSGSDAVNFQMGGTVENQGGQILGFNHGVLIAGGSGAVGNSGLIDAAADTGVRLESGGSINNRTGGLIRGYNNAATFVGGTGSVVNSGSMQGRNANGIEFNAGGSVDNQAGGAIEGANFGVAINQGLGSVNNAGTINGDRGAGVLLAQGGSLNNLASGTIQGALSGVVFSAPNASAVNAGAISAVDVTGHGIDLDFGGTMNNRDGATIYGGANGLYVLAGKGFLLNGTVISVAQGQSSFPPGPATISGGDTAVLMSLGGTVENRVLGTIQGGSGGLLIFGGEGTVLNSGAIVGGTGSGVSLAAGGTVQNQATGLIQGGQDGLLIGQQSGVVINLGNIIGTTGQGVGLDVGGFVNNQSGGMIRGGRFGIAIGSGGSVDNSGVVQASSTDAIATGVRLPGGGAVNNRAGAAIEGSRGIWVSGALGAAFNSGFISGANGAAIQMDAGGTVNNLAGGRISGTTGINISGGAGSIVNAGKIIGAGGTAIQLGDLDNSVTLQTGSQIQGRLIGGAATDTLLLQGNGNLNSDTLNFEQLIVQAQPSQILDFSILDRPIWRLGGVASFTQGVSVDRGFLQVDGTLTSPTVNVGFNGAIGGNGTIVGTLHANGGVLSPGGPTDWTAANSAASSSSSFNFPSLTGGSASHYVGPYASRLGVLTVAGSLVVDAPKPFEAAGSRFALDNVVYYLNVDPQGHSDLVKVTQQGGAPGTATVNGGYLQTILQKGVYGNRTEYTILTAAGGVTGKFYEDYAPGSTLWPYLTSRASLAYQPGSVKLVISSVPSATYALTPNQKAIASALDNALGSPANLGEVEAEVQQMTDASALRSSLDALSGEAHATFATLDLEQQNAFVDSFFGRLQGIRTGKEGGELALSGQKLATTESMQLNDTAAERKPWGAWARGYGTFGNLESDGSAAGADFTLYGASAGLEFQICPKLLAGLGLGYSHNDARVDERSSTARVDAGQVAAYGTFGSGPIFLDGVLAYSYLQTDTERRLNIGATQQTASADYAGNAFSAALNGGYAWRRGCCEITPSLGAAYTHLSQDSFQETGAGYLGLSAGAIDLDSLRSRLGLRLSTEIGKGKRVRLFPELQARWEHEFLDQNAILDAQFLGGGGTFLVRGLRLDRDTGVVGGGFTVAVGKSIQAFAGYDTRLNAQLVSHTVSGSVTFRW